MLARSSFVSSDFIARSGLPTSPMNKVSPLNMLNGFLVLSKKADAGSRNFRIGQNTNFQKIEYPKNSLLGPDKWAPAAPWDW